MEEPEIELETRREIFNIIKEYPGLNMRAIERKTGMVLNLVKYHLQKLEEMELVNKIEEEGYNRYYPEKYPGERLDYKDKRLLGLLRNETPLGIVVYLLNNRGKAKHKEIRDALDLPASTLSYHLKKLKRKNVIKKTDSFYKIIDEKHISHLLLEYGPPDDVVERFVEVWEDFVL
ncbi:MAG: winged helix-turn-helix transcriptional regulator [Candidatus Saliniplasma sp.]